jgi:hypothetical protein
MQSEPVEFGTSGYTLKNTFVLYDRKTGSVWYPLTGKTLDAVAGPAKGQSIEYLAKPRRMTLRQWRSRHPDTLVMLPPPVSETVHDLRTKAPAPSARRAD